jgi:hypothetical protein
VEKIEITYSKNPRGLMGQRPRKLKRGEEIEFTCKDEGDLTIEFVGESPLDGGGKQAKKGKKVKLGDKAGLFRFRCILKVNGVEHVLEPTVGGELEIGPP